jgi:serine/threonine-protein kinase
MPPPSDKPTVRLADLLLRWEDLREQGKEPSPEELCADCPELVEELKRRIEVLKQMDPVLDTTGTPGKGVAEQTFWPGKGNDALAADLLRPAQAVVPGFRILGVLGRGGMGQVFRAEQLAHKRQVALKMIRTGLRAPPEAIARFRREARTISRLSSPNIVKIYEIGEYQGQPYLVLELVEGGTLSQKWAGKPMPPVEAARLVEALARAIHHAHSHGIIHRDLKPANILLTRDGVPKLTDFGLAKPMDTASLLTRSGAILGTPCYMSPEQAAGRGHDAGPLTDIYGLGTILYQVLTGRPPFQAETAFDTLRMVEKEPPLPPSQQVPEVPPELERICLKCLEKEPTNRYPTALALAEDLQRFLAG